MLSLQTSLMMLFGGLALWQLSLTNQLGTPDLFSSSFIFWVTAAMLIWQRKEILRWRSGAVSTGLGICLLCLLAFKGQRLFEEDYFLRLAPVALLSAWGLLASGFVGLRQFKKELVLLLFLAIPWEFVYWFDISLLTAKFSAGLLWLMGFEVVRQGVWIELPTGSIEVYNGCSGVRMIFQLLGIAWLVMALVPTRRWQRIGLVLSAVGIGFGLNSVRVALMAVLVAMSNTEMFDYWHVGTGSLVFSGLGVVALAAAGYGLLRSRNQEVWL